MNPANLSLPQLNQLKQQLENEIKQLTQSFSALKETQMKFRESIISLEPFKEGNEGVEILVPLTPSMYVPGKLASTEKLLVDIGTGYYAEKDVEGAKGFFERKVDLIGENAGSIQEMVEKKQQDLQYIHMVMQARIQQAQQEQQKK
eukprot:TRINITY_DN3000_c0_g2_i1.p1 TRINITY_DN3000_c0_g2~~TRINITY_DN3000_c0_g2_i1.p1  ORF type:complete len:146 (-),score=58.49 TRINITY_DN3000_c0_g2_i1:211-648(-)